MEQTFELRLSELEVQWLVTLLDEKAIDMDDNGNEGAFERSPLKRVLDELSRAERMMQGERERTTQQFIREMEKKGWKVQRAGDRK